MMEPIEGAITPPAESMTRRVVGYWHMQEVYCPMCIPAGERPPLIWEPIETQTEPVHALVCSRCGTTVELTDVP